MFEVLGNLHFLRPWWFLALLPIVFMIWRIWQVNRKQGAWHQVIEPKFRKLLLGENSSTEPTVNEKLGYFGLAFAWFFCVVALAGPWVKSVEVPAQKSQQGVVIVLDLSLSMLADDISPNRLKRVQYTLTDLLKQYPEYATGMVAYAGSAHTISPISEDNKTLLGLLPSLNPVVMPSFGSKPILGLNQADALLKGAQISHGHIIWITDDIESNQIESVSEWINSKSYSLTLLTVGSEKGGVVQIPNYGLLKDDKEKLILPKVPLSKFAQLHDKTDIQWQHLQIGMDNLQALIPPKMTTTESNTEGTDEKEIAHPLDIGSYFLFLLIPLAAFIFRRGILLTLVSFVVLPATLLTPQPSYAESKLSDFADVFKSQDQLGYQAWEEQKYETAEALFENRQWRASALYRQGKYKEAAKLYELDKTATGFFNKGNALAKSLDLDAATEAYEQALLLNPNMQQAKENLQLVNQLKNVLSSHQEQQNNSDDQQNQDQQATSNEALQDGNSVQQSQQGLQSESAEQQSTTRSNETVGSQAGNDLDQPISNGNGYSDSNNDSNPDNTGDASAGQASDANNPSNQTADNTDNSANTDQTSGGSSGIAEGTSGSDNTSNGDSNPTQQNQAQRLADPSAHTSGESTLNKAPLSEEEQAQQNWLKQIPDEPGLFLKRKFEYQFQQNPNADNSNQKQW